jgi:transitional endoplasmic reticulum ATPase
VQKKKKKTPMSIRLDPRGAVVGGSPPGVCFLPADLLPNPTPIPGTRLSLLFQESELTLRAYPHSLPCPLLPANPANPANPVEAANLANPANLEIANLVEAPRGLEAEVRGCLAMAKSGTLLWGPGRCGKTVLLGGCARLLGLPVVPLGLGRAETLAGQEEKAVARALAMDAVVVVRGVARARGSVLGALLEGMTASSRRARVVVVAESPDEVPTALRRPGRLDREVAVGYPAVEQRRSFLERRLPGLDAEALTRLARSCPGLSYPAMASWIGAAAVRASVAKDGPHLPGEQDLMATLAEVPSLTSLAGGERSLVSSSGDQLGPSWDDIGGTEEAKARLREALEGPLRDPARFLRFGVRPARGVLLCGPPGVSKTMLAKAAARSAPAALFTCSGASLYSMYFGEAERQLRELFKAARLSSPAILFIDELDAVVPARGESSAGGQDQDQTSLGLLSTLLNEMDGVGPAEGVLVVAATNRIDLIDQALLRPGRFDSVVHIPLPGQRDRLEILKIATRSVKLGRDVDLGALAEATEGFSGAELVSSVREAAMAAMREYSGVGEIMQRHFSAVK